MTVSVGSHGCGAPCSCPLPPSSHPSNCSGQLVVLEGVAMGIECGFWGTVGETCYKDGDLNGED